MTPLRDLTPQLHRAASQLGYAVDVITPSAARFSKDGGSRKWVLGARTVTLRAAYAADDSTGRVSWREMRVESSRGVPPPALTVEHEGRRSDLQAAVEHTVTTAGWTFVYEAGKTPA